MLSSKMLFIFKFKANDLITENMEGLAIFQDRKYKFAKLGYFDANLIYFQIQSFYDVSMTYF